MVDSSSGHHRRRRHATALSLLFRFPYNRRVLNSESVLRVGRRLSRSVTQSPLMYGHYAISSVKITAPILVLPSSELYRPVVCPYVSRHLYGTYFASKMRNVASTLLVMIQLTRVLPVTHNGATILIFAPLFIRLLHVHNSIIEFIYISGLLGTYTQDHSRLARV